MPDKTFADMSIEELQAAHRKRREQLATIRTEMNAIEAALEPKLDQHSAMEKVRRAGLSKRELRALTKK